MPRGAGGQPERTRPAVGVRRRPPFPDQVRHRLRQGLLCGQDELRWLQVDGPVVLVPGQHGVPVRRPLGLQVVQMVVPGVPARRERQGPVLDVVEGGNHLAVAERGLEGHVRCPVRGRRVGRKDHGVRLRLGLMEHHGGPRVLRHGHLLDPFGMVVPEAQRLQTRGDIGPQGLELRRERARARQGHAGPPEPYPREPHPHDDPGQRPEHQQHDDDDQGQSQDIHEIASSGDAPCSSRS